MAQSTSSQDLLNLLMRGGAADSLESLAKDQHQQLATPISPTGRPAPRPSHSREATPSGQDTLEALFSSLRGSAPPNSNISPSAVSHAERQSSTSQFQAAIASPSTSNTALRAQTGVSPISSPPHLDNAQGRSLLLSMLNVRSPPTQEAALASPSLNAAVPNTTTDKASEAEQLHGDGIKQDTNHHEQEAAEVRLADVSPTQLDATSPEDVMQEEEKAQDRGDDTIPAISVTTRQQESLDLPASSSNGSAQTIVREASPDAPESVSTAAPDLQNIVAEDKLRITDLGSSSHTLNVPSGPPDASFGVSVEAGNDEVLEPLHEIRLEAGSSSTTGERFVYDRVPISRFTSTNSYTKGKQIAVNGLIAYGTRAGRVRVIDPDTGARLIKKLHSGLATDMDLSIEFSSEGQKTRRLVTCYNNTIKVWQIPSSFDGDDATNRIVYELSLDKHIIVHSVSFSNSNANHLAFTTSRSQEVYLIDLSEQIGSDYAPATVGNTELKRFAIFTLPSPVSALAWSRNGSELAGVSVDGDLALYLLEDRQALHIQLGKRNDDLGPITQIALLQQRHDAHPAALLALSARGLVVDLYSLSNPKRPTSRVRIDQSDAANSPSPDQAFGRASLLPQYDTILLSTSIGNQLHAIKFDLPAELSPPSRLTDYVTWCKGPLSASQQEADSVNAGLKSSPYFIDTQSISTPHHVLQMVSAELSEKPGIFYLHADGFEQISLDPAFYDAFESKTSNESEANSGSSEVNKGLPTQTEAPKPSTANGNEFLEAFDNSVRDLPHFSNAPLQSADAATGRTSPAVNSVPIDTTSATDSTHETFQHLITQQNLVFSQMLAAQQQIHETRYQQLSKELALLRQQQVDPYERVSKAIRTELRENFLPVIATALAEIGSSPASTHGMDASLSSTLSQQEQLLHRCTETMNQLFASFTRQLAPAITEALSGTLERHLANLIIGQAEQGDAMVQMRAIMLAEQMKREQLSTALEADMQIIKTQLQECLRHRKDDVAESGRHVPNGSHSRVPLNQPKSAARSTPGTSNDISREPTYSNHMMDRPSTPSTAYEDMFLHSLSRNPDPLKDLIDDGPSTRMDRVLPYDGQPRITAPAFLALCIQLAKDFDNDLTTLDAGNERVRLAWILASLRASKWAKGDPNLAAYLPRVFTQVMHTLNRRKQKLLKPEDREELSRALQMADELSGLW